jgi:hypothetical protein
LSKRDRERLQRASELDGYDIDFIQHPADFRQNRGQTFGVRCKRGNTVFEESANSEPLAFCAAALKTRGIEIIR